MRQVSVPRCVRNERARGRAARVRRFQSVQHQIAGHADDRRLRRRAVRHVADRHVRDRRDAGVHRRRSTPIPDVALVLHVGDIHSGKQYCTEAYDRQISDLWTAFQDPLVYTPGDNEWTDCHKAARAAAPTTRRRSQIDYVLDADGNPVDYANGDPVANLDLVRSIFFANPGARSASRKRRCSRRPRRSTRAHPTDGVRRERDVGAVASVLFVTINLPGGSNNDDDVWYGAPTDDAAQTQESRRAHRRRPALARRRVRARARPTARARS